MIAHMLHIYDYILEKKEQNKLTKEKKTSELQKRRYNDWQTSGRWRSMYCETRRSVSHRNRTCVADMHVMTQTSAE